MEKSEDLDVEIYNDEQRFWANVKENGEASVQQYKDGIKLAEATTVMAEAKIEENATKE